MRVQLLTLLAVCACASAALVTLWTAWIATTPRWRDQRVVSLHLFSGFLCTVALSVPTIVNVPMRLLLVSSSLTFAAGAAHYHAWIRVLAYLQGRPVRRWEYAPLAIALLGAAVSLWPGAMFLNRPVTFGYAPWGMVCTDALPNLLGQALIGGMIVAHLPTVARLVAVAFAGDRRARLFAVAAVGEVIFTGTDSAAAAGAFPLPYLTPFWMMLYMFAIAASIARRFVDDAGELDALSNRLEDRVAARTRELADARRTAEEALQARGNFLAMMSHEIRTPLNGVLGMTGVLLDGELTTEQRAQLETIQRCGASLLTLLNDILDFTKIEAGRLALEELAYDPRALATGCLDVLAQLAVAGGTQVTCAVSPEVPSQLLGDPSRVRQVLLNLAGNAVKFTPGGTVRVTVDREADGRLRFAVRDTGVGIAPDALARLFEPFVQADASTTRRFGGTGLGLAICRRLVAAMGGEIRVESALGQGSTFWFTLPLRAAPDVAPTVAPAPTAARGVALRVLVAEDNAVNQLVVQAILARRGHAVTTVSNGREALDVLATAPFDVVLMDCEMPELDGYTATRLLRAREGGATHTRVVALTANAFEEDRVRALAAGMDAWVAKPFRQQDLLRALVSLTPRPITEEHP